MSANREELRAALTRLPRWKWFATDTRTDECWSVGPCKTLEEAMSSFLALSVFSGGPTPPFWVGQGRRATLMDYAEGLDEDQGWIIPTAGHLLITLEGLK